MPDPDLARIARWLESRPWNRPGTDEAWLRESIWAVLVFDREVVGAEGER